MEPGGTDACICGCFLGKPKYTWCCDPRKSTISSPSDSQRVKRLRLPYMAKDLIRQKKLNKKQIGIMIGIVVILGENVFHCPLVGTTEMINQENNFPCITAV